MCLTLSEPRGFFKGEKEKAVAIQGTIEYHFLFAFWAKKTS
jgi:hypothetical protein